MNNSNLPNHDVIEGALLLDFRFLKSAACTLVTCAKFPLENPSTIAAAFGERAFPTEAATDVWVDLLYALEKEFDDWEECRPEPTRLSANSERAASESRIVLVTRLKTTTQFNRAVQLFLGTASALVAMLKDGGK